MKITLENINKNFGAQSVFDGLSVSFEDEKITCVLGASGTGKTTLLRVLCGLEDCSGDITPKDFDVSYIFQNTRLIPQITVYENLDLVLRSKIKDKKERKKRIAEMLSEVELLRAADKLPTELSGGEAQRISMARAFLYPAEVLLLDEPFKGLDIALKNRLLTVFRKLFAASPRTTVFVTHDAYEALLLADRIIVLSGSPARIVFDRTVDVPADLRDAFSPDVAELKASLVACLSRE